MTHTKLLTLAFLAGAALATSASAALTYSVTGSLNSTTIPAFENGAPMTVSFDYDPIAAGPDFNPNPPYGRYLAGITNISITVGETEYSTAMENFMISYGGGGMCTFTLNMGPLSPGIDDFNSVSAQLQFVQFGSSLDSDAAPESLDIPWSFGTLMLTYASTVDGEEGMMRSASGSFQMNTLDAVPEPSSALLIGIAGTTALLRRRRTRSSH
jgi:hypothetical protein